MRAHNDRGISSAFVGIRSLYGQEYASREEGILLINLGSPASPEVSEVKRYLTDFLMDERVISVSSPLYRNLLVKGLIIPLRVKTSAANYRKIWEPETQTFPLVRYSAQIAQALSHRVGRSVALAMRYGAPTMDDALRALYAQGIRRVKVLPLYPHYTRSSFETAVVHAMTRRQELGLELELEVVEPFYNHPRYRRALAEHVRERLPESFDKLIISMHGIPLSHLSRPCAASNGDTKRCLEHIHSEQEGATCYRLHCESTAEWLRQDLGLEPQQVELVYQSRLGNHEWIKPYFSTRVKEWAREGARRVVVVSPCFVCDCLETLEEIDVEYRQSFMQHGGESFAYIPCLGSSEPMIETLAELLGHPAGLRRLTQVV